MDWDDTRRMLAVLSAADETNEAWDAFEAMVVLDNRLRRLGVSLRERAAIAGRVTGTSPCPCSNAAGVPTAGSQSGRGGRRNSRNRRHGRGPRGGGGQPLPFLGRVGRNGAPRGGGSNIDATPEAGPRIPFLHGPYRIDRGRLADLPAIARLEAEVFVEPLSLGRILRLYCRPGTRYLVARLDGWVVAFFGFELLGPTAHVISNVTDPDHRRRGLADALLRAGEGVAARGGARWLLGEVRAANALQMRILEGLGWRCVGSCARFFRNGEDARIVLRMLEPRGAAAHDRDRP